MTNVQEIKEIAGEYLGDKVPTTSVDILSLGRQDRPFRQVQIDALKWFVSKYDDHDVFVFDAPTATGKSLIVTTIAQFLAALRNRTSVITPTKLLQDQYLRDFEDIPVLKGQSAYTCAAMGIEGTCRETKKRLGKCCMGEGGELVCPYLIARAEAEAATTALFNFHSYFANKMYKDTLIADEGHNTINFLLEFYALKLWKCEVGYEDNVPMTAGGIKQVVVQTIATLSMTLIDLQSQHAGDKAIDQVEDEIERLGYIRDSIERFGDDLLIVKDEGEYFGKMRELRKTKQEYIYVKPVRINKIGGDLLWPVKKVKKVILLSATINEMDVTRLGLDANKRVAYYRCDSPIPPERRPFLYSPVGSMKYGNRPVGLPKILKAIKILAAHHKDQKGVIHCTYDTAQKMRAEFAHDPRYWFHDKFNKTEVYNRFRATPGNQILVASGMEEGIDLAFDAGRWQVITQLMRPNVEDKVNAWLYHNDRKTYNWETVRKIIQQTGRICRDPKDFGVTYMLDAEFEYFYNTTLAMWPQWFRDGVKKLMLNVPA